MADSQYCGPRVDAHRLRDATRRRVESYVARRASELHHELVARWASEDDTLYPSFLDARRQAEFEVETLLRSLGRWAAVPERAIPFPTRFPGYLLRPLRPDASFDWMLGDELDD